MFLPPFELLPQCWSSEWVSLSKFVHRPFKRNIWNYISPLCHSATIPVVFIARNYEDYSTWHWNPGLGGLLWDWNALLLKGDYATEIFIWNSSSHMWFGTHLSIFLSLSYQSPHILSYKTLFSCISGDSQWWLFCSLFIILMWLQENISIALTCWTNLTGLFEIQRHMPFSSRYLMNSE